MADAPSHPQRPLPRRGIERLDLMLLCAEALDLNGGEAMVWLSEEMGFTDLLPNRVELWKRRCSNPLRRTTRRDLPTPAEGDALIRICNALADRLYPMLRSLLSTAEPPQLSAQRWQLFEGRLAELLRERFNLRRGGVQRKFLGGGRGTEGREGGDTREGGESGEGDEGDFQYETGPVGSDED